MNKIEEVCPSYWQTDFGATINVNLNDYSYPQICFNYIHMNPVTDKLVRSPEEWEFSSYRDYFCERKGTLIDYDLARKEELLNCYDIDTLTRSESIKS
ncbi:hypothetical protein [Marinifilum sp. D737]|uniref:hypothetical protein n=1 Tax=Marinifilum sp. D737 TaxID=2969628 RepID=UPI002274B216|nr:hypothetical protein [Marinifilum sp. D737]MCY1633884.1 hypothetical protein [Marinifilum sp. D737]